MNRNQLARALGTSWQHVDHWEKGRTRPTVESVRRLAELLGVSVDHLLAVEPEPAERSTLEQFLAELAPTDLSAEEAQWLRVAPIDDARATPEDYLALLERLRDVGRSDADERDDGRGPAPRSGTRPVVDRERLRAAMRDRDRRDREAG